MWALKIFVVIFCVKCFCAGYVQCGDSRITNLSERDAGNLRGSRVRKSVKPAERPSISICCPSGTFMTSDTVMACMRSNSGNAELVYDVEIPEIYRNGARRSTQSPETFQRIYGIPCKYGFYELTPESNTFYLQEDGRLFLDNTNYDAPSVFVELHDYCLSSWMRANGTTTKVLACFPPEETKREIPLGYTMSLIVSLPFLAATFAVYAVLPELRNIPGLTLMHYVAVLCMGYSGLVFVQLEAVGPYHFTGVCAATAFIIHFSFLSSFFWLNVMCFDIWWTFGGFRALQGSVKQREKKKFLIYSIYAWGCASIITSVSLIMDFVPGIPESYVKPRFGHKSCWFPDDNSKAVYFYGPMGVTVVCNIVLFVSTALKILRHKRDTATHLKTSESRRHDDNKQWFNLYLKLFIVMGISWSMEIISWLLDQATPQYIWYLTDLANTLQGVVIFIIFVWKAKIRRLLIRRFGCQKKNFQSGNSTRSGYHSSASNKTCTSIALHDKIPNDRNRINTTTDESDCV